MHFVFFILLLFSCPRLSPDRSQGFVWCGDPPQPYKWHSPPIVRVCSGDKDVWNRVDTALDFYRQLGHEFGVVVYGDKNGDSCDGSSPFSITIRQALFSNKDLRGQTTTRSSGDLILRADVKILYGHTGADNLIMEHELGHALGYKHIECRGHVMYPHTNRLGTNVAGMKVKSKIKQMSSTQIEVIETISCGEK